MSKRKAVMSAAHTKANWGITKTAERIANKFVWEKMQEDIKNSYSHIH